MASSEDNETTVEIEPVPAELPPPPTLIKPMPVQAADPEPVHPSFDRGRAGVTLLVFSAMLLAGLGGWLGGAAVTTHQTANIPPIVETTTQTRSMTATATSTETESRTRVVPGPTMRVTTTATARKTVYASKPGPTKTTTIRAVPRSCFLALDAANAYIAAARRLRGHRQGNGILHSAEKAFEKYARDCRRA